MNLPPIVYAASFWQALAMLVAGADGLLVFFGVLPAQWTADAEL